MSNCESGGQVAAGLRDHPSIGPKMWIQLCYRRIPEGLIEHLESGSIIGNVVLDNRTGRSSQRLSFTWAAVDGADALRVGTAAASPCSPDVSSGDSRLRHAEILR